MNKLATRSLVSRHAGYAKAAVAAVVLVASAAANAALDAAVQTTLDGAKADVIAIGAIVFGIAVAIVLYKWFKRAL